MIHRHWYLSCQRILMVLWSYLQNCSLVSNIRFGKEKLKCVIKHRPTFFLFMLNPDQADSTTREKWHINDSFMCLFLKGTLCKMMNQSLQLVTKYDLKVTIIKKLSLVLFFIGSLWWTIGFQRICLWESNENCSITGTS